MMVFLSWFFELASFLQMSVIVKMVAEVDDVVKKPFCAAEISTANDLLCESLSLLVHFR